MLQEELVTHEVAKLAREKGFNEKCYHYYQNRVLESDGCFNRYNKGVDSICSAPTQSLLQRWLREEKGCYVYPFFDNEELKWTYVVREKTGDMWLPLIGETPYYDKYEDAMDGVLKFVLKNLV